MESFGTQACYEDIFHMSKCTPFEVENEPFDYVVMNEVYSYEMNAFLL